jgi:hypothetical protein
MPPNDSGEAIDIDIDISTDAVGDLCRYLVPVRTEASA